MLNCSRTRMALAMCGALVAGLTLTTSSALALAMAGSDPSLDPLRAKLAQCSKRPTSLVEMCVLQAHAEFDAAFPQPPKTAEQQAALDQADARYRDAYAACAKLISSEVDTCRAQAQAERSHTVALVTGPTETFAAYDREMQTYAAAVESCRQLPLSEREICVVNAGTPRTLVVIG